MHQPAPGKAGVWGPTPPSAARGPLTSEHLCSTPWATTIGGLEPCNLTVINFYIIHTLSILFKVKLYFRGLPWWHSGWESACQCRGHGFEPWSGKIPHAAEQLGPCATTTEPVRLEPVLRNGRGRDSERPAHRDEEWPPLAATRENPHRNEDPTQPKIN